MVSLRRPSGETVRAFLASQSDLGFTYEAVGATARVPPEGYAVDHTRIKMGKGEEVFLRAKAALRRWQQFRLGWVEAWPSQDTIEAGGIVAVVAHEPGPVSRYGFAYGTLPDHAGTGEERFLVEWDRASGEVRYDILAFSRPHLFLTRLGYPYLRRVQKRFGKESAAAMVRAVTDDAG
jgi:uncharacterized protein (UPF0548 family)